MNKRTRQFIWMKGEKKTSCLPLVVLQIKNSSEGLEEMGGGARIDIIKKEMRISVSGPI